MRRRSLRSFSCNGAGTAGTGARGAAFRLPSNSVFGVSAVTTLSVFSTSKETMSCFFPSSRIVKSAAFRSLMNMSFLSRTVRFTRTTSVDVFSVNCPLEDGRVIEFEGV